MQNGCWEFHVTYPLLERPVGDFQSGKIVVSDLTGDRAKSFTESGLPRVLLELKLFVAGAV
jgi:hypothetical protein